MTPEDEQVLYESLRPCLVFQESPEDRARKTGITARTISRKVKQFREQGMGCVYCRKDIEAYPFYVADDFYLTKYHMACATQLAMDILGNAAFVIEQLPKTSIKQAKKQELALPEEQGTSAMAKAFRETAKQRGETKLSEEKQT